MAVVYKDKELSTSLKGQAKIKIITEQDINDYLSSGNPLDKAGGFAGDPAEGGVFLESYNGEPGQELGLPTTTLKEFLQLFGLKLNN